MAMQEPRVPAGRGAADPAEVEQAHREALACGLEPPMANAVAPGSEDTVALSVPTASEWPMPSVTVAVVAHPVHTALPLSAPMEKMIKRYNAKLDERMGGVVGRTAVELDPRETACRFREGLLTGFVCDVIASEMRLKISGTDFAVIGGAAFSGKATIPPGNLTMGDIFDLFPNDTRVMCLRMPGSAVRRMLTVMVREVPGEAPSFPHCSGELRFTISLIGGTPAKIRDVTVRGEPLDDEKQYTVAVEDFAGKGSGKYKFLRGSGAETLVDEENAAQVVFWLIDYFNRKKGQSQKSGEALEQDAAVAANAQRGGRHGGKGGRRSKHSRTSPMSLSITDFRQPRFVFPLRQFKTVEFAA
ncbi:MAG: 5'-nucleotidase, partial [Dehalococcoidia bacterium]|nr:5'-nucleotidase [Dehalococcoidia bacterium]